MAIIEIPITPTPSVEDRKHYEINNGDFQILQQSVTRLGFKDGGSLLRFVLAVIGQSATRSLKITDTNGKEVPLNPSPALLAMPSPTNPPITPPSTPPVETV